MKSQHRHELETNALAHRVAAFIDVLRPYSSIIFGTVAAIAVLMLGISYFSGESAARQREAWDAFNQAIEGPAPDLGLLHKSAEENAGTTMQEWADATWADGQLWLASMQYLQNRSVAADSLGRAMSAYQSLLKDTSEPELISRAHFGLARAYELRNELDKAREEYMAVDGGFSLVAKQRAVDLEKKRTKDAYDWLATAQTPRQPAPGGPGTPGQRPQFSEDQLDMPQSAAPGEPGEAPSANAIEDLFKGIGQAAEGDSTENRYENQTGAPATPAEKTGDTKEAPPK